MSALVRHAGTFGRSEARQLLTRACFGASPRDIDLAGKLGLEDTVEALLAGEFRPRVSPSTLMRVERSRPDSLEKIRARFCTRALLGGDVLRSRLQLFWHDHFATAFRKVRSPIFMSRHLDLLREHALGNFGEMVLELATDAAMLIWLDGKTSTRRKPNENFARELFELFTLGRGHYGEADIRQAARAFTGWHVNASGARFVPADHDDGEKRIFGGKRFRTPEGLITIVLARPQSARFVGGRLGRVFLGEAAREEELGPRLAELDFDIRAFVGEVLRSRAMFSKEAAQRRLRGPLEYVLGGLRAIEARGSGTEIAATAAAMGQSVADPPSVAGWPQGRAWISSATIAARQRFAIEVNEGRASELALRSSLPEETPVQELAESILGQAPSRDEVEGASFFETAARILACPEAQLI